MGISDSDYQACAYQEGVSLLLAYQAKTACFATFGHLISAVVLSRHTGHAA